VRSVFVNAARRFVGLITLLFFALPFGLAVSGCGHKAAPVQFCSTGDSGPVVGQVATITLSANLATTGESLNYGQIGQGLSASAADCKGNAVSVKGYTFASTSSFSANNGVIFADINPASGQVCGGTWNRNTGGGIADFTTCSPPSVTPSTSLAYVTATANGAVSNAIPVYVHPVVTGIVLGSATPGAKNGSCPAGTSDPGTDCCPNDTVGVPVSAPVYTASSCLSQTKVGQLVARVYSNGTTNPANNITCQVGHLSFAAQTPSVVSIDENGAGTAQQPGSTIITATIANSSTATNAGFFSTCPPASIVLSAPGQTPGPNGGITVAINNLQPLIATVIDTQGNPINGLTLEFNSSTPQTIPAAIGSVTPLFPGAADITAVCQPTTCNTAPFSQIGLYGNGKPITSNPITVNAAGNSSTVLYMGSTDSQYVAFRDFTTNQPSALIKLPYLPNSMVMNLAGTAVYFGSSQGLMTVNASTNSFGSTVQTVQGIVLSVSPDGNTLVVTDPVRQTVSLIATAKDTLISSYGGIGTSAAWSPDDQTVYITTASGNVLTHSPFTDWQTAAADEIYTNVAVTVPSIGAYFAGPSSTEARSYCPSSTIGTSGNPPTVANEFLPVADRKAVPNDRIAATTNGKHILGATATTTPAQLSDIEVVLPSDTACPTVIPTNYFPSSFTTQPLTGINAASITGVVPSSNSKAAFVTYTGPAANAPAGSVASGLLPLYLPAATGSGTLQFIALRNGATTATAPIAGVFSTDNFTFYVGTSGDNQVHLISMTYPTGAQPTATESGVLTPNLPVSTGVGYAAINLIAQHPKKSTN
jgi:hypothetical protein